MHHAVLVSLFLLQSADSSFFFFFLSIRLIPRLCCVFWTVISFLPVTWCILFYPNICGGLALIFKYLPIPWVSIASHYVCSFQHTLSNGLTTSVGGKGFDSPKEYSVLTSNDKWWWLFGWLEIGAGGLWVLQCASFSCTGVGKGPFTCTDQKNLKSH